MATGTSDLAGRNIVITGANTGIGRATAELLAARGAHVVLACRSVEKTAPVLAGIQAAGGSAEGVALDLGDLDQVRACAAGLLATDRPIHVLLNNAGLAGTRGLTKSGFELAFGTNHVGHFLLTMLLAPRLRATPSARIVNVSSKSHYRAKGIDFDAVHTSTRSITGLPEYEVSKLANVLFTKELARRLGPSGVRSYALHPGVVASDAWRRIPWPFRALLKLGMITNEEGAKTSIYCATSPEVAEHDGRYYDACREKAPNPIADDAALARALWEKSVAWTGADLTLI
jgi:NAD(P)-dependent dehydrogenase (short-subunit alcohol dehydrogenase family)